MSTPIVDLSSQYQGGFTKPRRSTELLIVHHAAAHYKQATGPQDVAAIANWHIRGNGWSGIGYHEVLAEETNGGRIVAYLVSNPETQRAHIALQNDIAFGICCATDFGTGLPARKWIDALADRLAVAQRRWPSARILGHKEAARPGHGTSCPGTRWAEWKPQLLDAVQQRLQSSAPAATILNGPSVPTTTLIAYLDPRTPHLTWQQRESIVCAYTSWGELTTVGNVRPFAQAVKEASERDTNGIYRPFNSRRFLANLNPAGMGATNDGAEGAKFFTIASGIVAQFAHLLCYAAKPESLPTELAILQTLSPRRAALMRTFGLGSAPTWESLNGKWAYPGPTYGQDILRLADEIAGAG